jgi:hypothetical protein
MGLNVRVFDQQNGAPLCDARVTATEGAYNERLAASGSCGHARPGERAGCATTTTMGVRVTADQCQVRGVQIDMRLAAVR